MRKQISVTDDNMDTKYINMCAQKIGTNNFEDK